MSKEMLEAFRVLEEENNINKEDIIDAVVESLKSATSVVMVSQNQL